MKLWAGSFYRTRPAKVSVESLKNSHELNVQLATRL
jgi:hypothetical protein